MLRSSRSAMGFLPLRKPQADVHLPRRKDIGSDDNANVWHNTRSTAAENARDRRLRTEPWQAAIRMWDSSCEASALRRASSQIRLPLEKDIDSTQSSLKIAASQDG